MRAAVLSLPRRTDRRERFSRYAAAAGLRWDFLDALEPDPPAGWPFSAGAFGCAQSHLMALRAGYELIFEDDAALPEDLLDTLDAARAELPEDWGVLKLGAQHRHPGVGYSAQLLRCRNTMRTHAYLVSERGRAELIRLLAAGEWHWDRAYAGYDRRGRSYALRVPVPVYDSASDIADSTPQLTGTFHG